MLPVSHTEIHPRKWPVLLPFIAPIVIFFMLGTQQDTRFLKLTAIISAAASLAIYFVLGRICITIDDQSISHKNLIRHKGLDWQKITNVFLRFERSGKSRRLYWVFDGAGSELKFASGFYSRADLKLLAETVVSKCTHAIIDERITGITEGKFPWYMI